LVATLLRARLVARRAVAQRVRLGLAQRGLVWPRIDAEEDVAFSYRLAFLEVHGHDLPIDAGLEGDGLVGLDVADCLQADRNRLLHHRGYRHGHGGRAFAGALAGLLRADLRA